jgi:DNA-binding NtrC family response regulator
MELMGAAEQSEPPNGDSARSATEFSMQSNLESLVRQMVDGHILYEEAVREVQKAFVRVALRENNGNKSRTARSLGMHRNTFSRTLVNLEIVERRRSQKVAA